MVFAEMSRYQVWLGQFVILVELVFAETSYTTTGILFNIIYFYCGCSIHYTVAYSGIDFFYSPGSL